MQQKKRAKRFREIFADERRTGETLDEYLHRLHLRVYRNLQRAVGPADT